VWEGFPGASTRVLLPLTLAFNVLAARSQASFAWLLLGNLPVVNGMRSLRDVPRDTHELVAGQIPNASVIVRADARWSFRNEGWRHMVAVSAPTSAVDVETWPHDDRLIQIDVQLRGRAPVVLTIREGADVLWQNTIFARPQRVTIPCHTHAGHAHLEFEASLEGLPQGIVANVRDEILSAEDWRLR
jgi:hypothetical protein